MAVPALYAASRVATLREIVQELRGQAAQSALAVRRLDASLMRVDRYQRSYVAAADPEMAPLMHAATSEVAAAIDTLRAAGFEEQVDGAEIPLVQIGDANEHLEALVEQKMLEEATAYLIDRAAPLVERARAAVPGLAAAIDEKTGARVPVAQKSAEAAATATTAAVLLGAALAVALALSGARILSGPLDRLRRSMARVAEGTFEAPSDLPYDRMDEVGDLSRSFRTMTLRLAELDRLKAEFVGSISHDLKTPVSVISGYTELLQDELSGTLNPRQNDILLALAEQTRTVQRRIDQLLEISRMESGRLQLEMEQIDLRHFAAELHREFEPTARIRSITLESAVHETTPSCIIADPELLRIDIIGNLIGNALKFTPAGGMITVSVRPDGERVVFEVSDTGPGIPDDQVARIFDRYYQGRGATGGAGMGLAIAKAAVDNHGGRIDVHSRIGRGTRFRVTLPQQPVSSQLPSDPSTSDLG